MQIIREETPLLKCSALPLVKCVLLPFQMQCCIRNHLKQQHIIVKWNTYSTVDMYYVCGLLPWLHIILNSVCFQIQVSSWSTFVSISAFAGKGAWYFLRVCRKYITPAFPIIPSSVLQLQLSPSACELWMSPTLPPPMPTLTHPFQAPPLLSYWNSYF